MSLLGAGAIGLAIVFMVKWVKMDMRDYKEPIAVSTLDEMTSEITAKTEEQSDGEGYDDISLTDSDEES